MLTCPRLETPSKDPDRGGVPDLTRRVRILAARICEELSGVATGVPDPFDWLADYGAHELQPHQAAVLDRVQAGHQLS